jgi:hypothetical protein
MTLARALACGQWFDVHDARGHWVASFLLADDAWCFANYALVRRGTVQRRLGL